MRRRLSVAIALLGNPRVVYLDEPTTGGSSRDRTGEEEGVEEGSAWTSGSMVVFICTHP